MLVAVTALVVIGLLLVLAAALQAGADAVTLALGMMIVCVGGLVIAVTRLARGRLVRPATCRECGGLVSAHAPYCPHCGARAG